MSQMRLALGKCPPPPDQVFLDRAWSEIAAHAGQSGVAVVLGTERGAICLPFRGGRA